MLAVEKCFNWLLLLLLMLLRIKMLIGRGTGNYSSLARQTNKFLLDISHIINNVILLLQVLLNVKLHS